MVEAERGPEHPFKLNKIKCLYNYRNKELHPCVREDNLFCDWGIQTESCMCISVEKSLSFECAKASRPVQITRTFLYQDSGRI